MQLPFVRMVLRALGVTSDNNMIADRPVRLPEVHVPRPALGLFRFVYRDLCEVYRQVGESVGLQGIEETDQPLYLSRAALSDDLRRTVGEQEFERALADQGFRIFRPEQHDLATQIRVVHAHKHIFGFWGSAFRLAYFSPRKKLTCYFGSEFPTSSFFLDRAVCGCLLYTSPSPRDS